jgi:hypothetical protein
MCVCDGVQRYSIQLTQHITYHRILLYVWKKAKAASDMFCVFKKYEAIEIQYATSPSIKGLPQNKKLSFRFITTIEGLHDIVLVFLCWIVQNVL